MEHALLLCPAHFSLRQQLAVSLPVQVRVDLPGILGPAPSGLSKSDKDAFYEVIHKYFDSIML